jgi:hypothetical protein
MARTILTATVIAAAGAFAVALLPSESKAEEAARAAVRDVPSGQFFVDCWMGMKWGDQPGQLVRGWICERPFIAPPKSAQATGASGSLPVLEEKADVAAIGLVGARR